MERQDKVVTESARAAAIKVLTYLGDLVDATPWPGTSWTCMLCLPRECFWPPQVGPTTVRRGSHNHKAYLYKWNLKSVEFDPQATTWLSGERSIYQAYSDACFKKGKVPLSRRAYTALFEEPEFRLGLPSTKEETRWECMLCVKLK